MRNILLFLILISISFYCAGCKKNEDTSKLNNFLELYNLHIADYKVVCFVPVDGCGSCIDPALNYSKNADKKFLLVMSSLYRKSFEYTIERLKFEPNNYILDYKHLAPKNGLISPTAPSFFFIKDSEVIRKKDLSSITDKKSILREVEKYLSE